MKNMKVIKKISELFKKIFFTKVDEIVEIKGIGFKPQDTYYIDEHVYFVGFKLKSNRYWKMDDYKKKKVSRTIVRGFLTQNGDDFEK